MTGKKSSAISEMMNRRVEDARVVDEHQDISGMKQADMVSEINTLRQKLEQQRKVISALKRDAMSDPLTGLVNRRMFDKELHRSLSIARRYKRQSALLMVDVNDFKSINDQLGHAAGDQVLVHISNLLRQNTRPTDVVARIGGDEFCVILNELPLGVNVGHRAEKLMDIVEKSPCIAGGRNINVSVSIGFYAFDDGDKPLEIIQQADQNMYERKGRASTE